MPVRMTFFEVLTAMAFAAFADAPVDVAVLEVGLGGLWDATNVVEAGTAVVLPVGLDHVPLLGTTLAEIATEKAGIIHPGATVVLAQQEPEAAEVLLRRCVEVGATVAREGLEFGVVSRATAVGGQLLTLQGLGGRYDDLYLPLHGAHQAANAAAALAAVEAFLGGGDKGMLDPELVREGFARVSSPGRLEVVRTSPTVLLDAAHNAHGMAATVAALSDAFAFTHLVAVVAVLGDKDAAAMLEVLEPAVAQVVVTRNGSPRAMPVEDLYSLATDVFGEDRVTSTSRWTTRCRQRSRWRTPRRSTAGRACSSPARSSRSARHARCCAGRGGPVPRSSLDGGARTTAACRPAEPDDAGGRSR